jgi:hypothetical protein
LRREALPDRLATARRYVLAGLVLAVPLFFLWDVVYDPFNLPKLALLAAGVALAGALRLAEIVLGAQPAGLGRAAVPAAAIAAPVLISWTMSEYRGWSVLGAYARFEGLLPFLLVVAAGVLIADAFPGNLRLLATALAAAGTGVALYALAQSLGVDPLDVPIVEEYAPSSVGQSNFVGGFLAIALPAALALWTSSAGRARVAAMAATIAIVLGIVFAFSQGGWMAAAAGVSVFAGAMLERRLRGARLAGALVAAAVAAVAVGLVLFSYVRPFSPLVPDTVRARGFWWRAAVSMAAESPVWGRGPGVYAIEGPHHRIPQDALAHDSQIADAPHSVPLAHLANHGVLGLAGFVVVVAWTVRKVAAARPSPLRDAFAAGAAAYFVQSLVSIDAAVVVFGLWVCVGGLAAAGGAPPDRPRPAAARSRARMVAAAVLAVALSGPALWWAFRAVADDARVLDAVTAAGEGRTADAFASFEDILRDRPDEDYRFLYGSLLGATAAREGDDGADEIERMREVLAFVDDLPEVRAIGSYADSLHQWSINEPDAEADALRLYERLLALDEYSPRVRVSAAEALIRLGRASEAVELLEFMQPVIEERFPEHGRFHPELWGALAVAYFHDGRPEDAGLTVRDALDAAEDAALDCHVLVAQELLRTGGTVTPREELLESSPGLRLCPATTLALLPGYDPGER